MLAKKEFQHRRIVSNVLILNVNYFSSHTETFPSHFIRTISVLQRTDRHMYSMLEGNILICIYFNASTRSFYNPLQKHRPSQPANPAAGNSFELMVKWFSDILLMGPAPQRLELCTNFRRLTWDKTPWSQANNPRTLDCCTRILAHWQGLWHTDTYRRSHNKL